LFRDYTAQHPKYVADVAYTLALRREKLPHRAFAIIQDGEILETSSPIKAPATAPSIAMIFSGQGAQWPGMGRELILSRPSFHQDIVCMDKVLQGLKRPPTWSLLGN
jgi:acyl transferase domain-containing protein